MPFNRGNINWCLAASTVTCMCRSDDADIQFNSSES